MKYKTILFDFDGVLCNDRFYEKTLLPKYKDIYDWIQINIFRDSDLLNRWMRNEINSNQINKLISSKTKIEFNLLNNLFNESIRLMSLNKQIIQTVKAFKNSDKKVAIVTDNMDVFSEITVDNHKLNNLFNIIVNSADYGYLKKDDNGKIFDIALSKIDQKIEESVLIDDSQKNINLYNKKGGTGFHYKNFNELQKWMSAKITLNKTLK